MPDICTPLVLGEVGESDSWTVGVTHRGKKKTSDVGAAKTPKFDPASPRAAVGPFSDRGLRGPIGRVRCYR